MSAAQIEAAKAQILSLQSELNMARANNKKDATLIAANSTAHDDDDELPEIRVPPATKVRRVLKGHFGKVTSMHWSGDSSLVASASQDGMLLLWNANTTNKLKSISLKSPYVMTVGMEPTQGKLVACGGLDNLVSVYKWDSPNNNNAAEPSQEMAHHDGFVSCVRFLGGEEFVLSSSGDSSLIKWHVETGRVLEEFKEHVNDVMCFCINPNDSNMIVSGSVDKSVKVWDLRTPKASIQSFSDIHQGDVNGVDMVHNAIGTASGDGTCQLLDLRAYGSVATFGGVEHVGEEGLTSCSFSKSGRILFAGHVNASVPAWDVLQSSQPAFVLQAHEKCVSDVGVNPQGDALCTASWDTNLKIWA